jgi:hypothetical protein
MIERVPEPWGLYVNNLQHFEATEQLGLAQKRLQLPYGLVEGEPTFPLTNWDPGRMDHFVNHYFPDYSPAQFPRGRMGNAQTHCLQLPHTYLFAHLAHGGTLETADLESFAGNLLPDSAGLVAEGWTLVEEAAPDRQAELAEQLEGAAAQEQREGSLSGLLFGDPIRFLTDLAMNLRVRSRLHRLGIAVEASTGVRAALRDFLRDFRPYQSRLGFQDAYGGPLYIGLNEQVLRLHDPVIDEACRSFTDWSDPAVRNGALARLLDALDDYCERAA